jgi:Zn finger protein HypA/HybF involved in hydrogenase expression/very-short-patch-repair endonuclease
MISGFLEFIKESKRRTISDFIERSKEKHGDRYDYSDVNYIDSRTPVVINCKTHGKFIQRPDAHIRGSGCIKCRNDKRRSNKDEFIEKSRKIHGDKYDYSNVEYKNADTPVSIICKAHGPFRQIPYSHLSARAGCPNCRESKGEIDVAKSLDNLSIKYIRLKKFDDCRGETGYPLPFDFYIPDYNMCIEYDGQQHYLPVFGIDKFTRLKINDKIKDEYCKKSGIKLLRISYKYKKFEDIKAKIVEFLSL